MSNLNYVAILIRHVTRAVLCTVKNNVSNTREYFAIIETYTCVRSHVYLFEFLIFSYSNYDDGLVVYAMSTLKCNYS